MTLVSFALAWLAVLVLAVFGAVHTRQNAGALPLCVVCAVVLVLCAAGFAGLLAAGAVLVLAAALAAAAALTVQAVRHKNVFWRQVKNQCLTPAFGLYLAGSLALAALLFFQQPLFTQWDEFSFWGTAAKVVKENNTLYTLVQNTNLAARSYPPALAVLSYYFQFLAPQFTPWLVYAAYGVLTFAVFAAVVDVLPQKAAGAAAFAGLVCVLLPFAAESWYSSQQLTAYSTAYADAMLGLLTAGGCAVWFGARPLRAAEAYGLSGKEGGFGTAVLPLQGRTYAGRLAAVALVILVLGLTKDVGLPLGLVVMLACFVDYFANDFLRGRKNGRAVLRWLGVGAVLGAAAVASYLVWALHLQASLGQNRAETGAASQMSVQQMLGTGIRELLGVGRTEKFSAVFSAMVNAFFNQRVTVFGTGLVTVGVIVLLLLAAFLLEQKGNRRRPVCFALVSTAGFAGYYFFQLLCYVYVFSEADGRNLASYPRYMSSYYLFWLLGAVCLLLLSVRARRKAASLTVLGVSAAVLGLCVLRIDATDTLLGRSATTWDTQTVIEARAQQVLLLEEKPERVLLISQWDDSARWYRYAYALEPVALYHVKGDNTVVELQASQEYPLRLDAGNIGAFMKENGCDTLLVDVIDDYFLNEFSALFTDGLAEYEAGRCFVYRMDTDTAGNLRFSPCEVSAAD